MFLVSIGLLLKWWDKFPHTQEVVNNVTRDFSSLNFPSIAKADSTIQKIELANAPATSSIKPVKTSTRSKKENFSS